MFKYGIRHTSPFLELETIAFVFCGSFLRSRISHGYGKSQPLRQMWKTDCANAGAQRAHRVEMYQV